MSERKQLAVQLHCAVLSEPSIPLGWQFQTDGAGFLFCGVMRCWGVFAGVLLLVAAWWPDALPLAHVLVQPVVSGGNEVLVVYLRTR